MKKNIPGVTWKGESIDDVEILRELPIGLVDLLTEVNGFILHKGALHVRGATLAPEWHSVRTAWRGEKSFYALYDSVLPSDLPFAQDQFGDQLLIRDGKIIKLLSETGAIEPLVDNLEVFFKRVHEDIKGFLNVGMSHPMEPGQLLFAYPPFCFQESGVGASLRPAPANEVILFHGELAKQIRDIPMGGQIKIKVTDQPRLAK